jgi:hypothetical protein
MCPDSTGENASRAQNDFDSAVEAYRQAQVAFLNGDLKPVMDLISRRDDVELEIIIADKVLLHTKCNATRLESPHRCGMQ